jgi:hypothetical protein
VAGFVAGLRVVARADVDFELLAVAGELAAVVVVRFVAVAVVRFIVVVLRVFEVASALVRRAVAADARVEPVRLAADVTVAPAADVFGAAARVAAGLGVAFFATAMIRGLPCWCSPVP